MSFIGRSFQCSEPAFHRSAAGVSVEGKDAYERTGLPMHTLSANRRVEARVGSNMTCTSKDVHFFLRCLAIEFSWIPRE
jgi:hypothetical protein